MIPLVLGNKVKIITPYNGKTKFKFWKDINIGDVLSIHIILRMKKDSRIGPKNVKCGGGYIETVQFRNCSTGITINFPLRSALKYLDKLGYIMEVNDD